MSNKNMPSRLALVASIIAVILIGFYTFVTQDTTESQVASSEQPEQTPLVGKDPFKEYLDKQQQVRVSSQLVQQSHSLPNQPIQPSGGNPVAGTTGTDPFKAFLEAQAKTQKEISAASPFATGK